MSLKCLSLARIMSGLCVVVCGLGMSLLLVEDELIWIVSDISTRRHVRLLLRWRDRRPVELSEVSVLRHIVLLAWYRVYRSLCAVLSRHLPDYILGRR